jgi:Cof subfamily protein (haloacid dehalogenase superfamily)
MSNDAAHAFLEEFNVATPPTMPLERALEREVYQVIVLLTPAQEHLLLNCANHLTTTRWHPGFLDAMPPNGGKDTGIGKVLEHLGLTPEQAMAFGDGENDISMLEYAGIGVAMGNSSDKVKASADYVTSTVDEDGIARAVEHFAHLFRL